MVAEGEVDKVANKVDNMVADIVAKKGTNLARRRRVPNLARRRKKGTQFGERVGHGGWIYAGAGLTDLRDKQIHESRFCTNLFEILTEQRGIVTVWGKRKVAGGEEKTLPEAQRTQDIESKT